VERSRWRFGLHHVIKSISESTLQVFGIYWRKWPHPKMIISGIVKTIARNNENFSFDAGLQKAGCASFHDIYNPNPPRQSLRLNRFAPAKSAAYITCSRVMSGVPSVISVNKNAIRKNREDVLKYYPDVLGAKIQVQNLFDNSRPSIVDGIPLLIS